MWHLSKKAILDLNMLNFDLFYMIALLLQLIDEVDSETLYSSDKSTKMHLSKQKDEMCDNRNKHCKCSLSTESNCACNAFILLSIIDAVKEQLYSARTA